MKNYIQEAFGTFLLVLIGTGAVAASSAFGNIGLLEIALAFGLVVMVVIYAIGGDSGAHINPAVTIALVLNNKFPLPKAYGYILFQILGAFIASSIVFYLFPDATNIGVTAPSEGLIQAVSVELLLTAMLVAVILYVTEDGKESSITPAIAIGATVTFGILVFGPISGASMNPARSIGPAFVALEFDGLLPYIFAQILGAAIAVLYFKSTRSNA